MDPKSKGERSTGQVLAALLRKGKVILLPFGDSQRYDLVVDEGDRFVRVQCKTGRLRRGAIDFPTCSNTWHRGGGKKDYRGEADLFGVYCPGTEKVYMIPVSVVGRTAARLRIDPARNGQKSGCRSAAEFEL